MRATPLSIVALAVAAALGSYACRSDDEDVLRSCPSAPVHSLRSLPKRCEFAGLCVYQPPSQLLLSEGAECNYVGVDCHEGTTRRWSTAIGCRPYAPPLCKIAITPGASCRLEPVDGGPTPLWWQTGNRNEECFVPDNAGDLGSEFIPGKTCACDLPGPVWRCTSGTYRQAPVDAGGEIGADSRVDAVDTKVTDDAIVADADPETG